MKLLQTASLYLHYYTTLRFEHLQDWLAWQQTLHSQKIELGLDRIVEVANALGILQPEYHVITVAGTNGKGSLVSILASIYHQAGYCVGSYTSPHLLHYNERIKVGKNNVDDKKLCEVFDLIDRTRGPTSLSYFEFGTLAAMQIFKDVTPDVAIFEVGLGGRLDAVNILDSDLAMVTNIGIDHVQWLGSTREQIGFEKAGIFRSQLPAVCGDEDPPESLIKYAHELDSKLYLLNKDYSYTITADATWSFHSTEANWENLPMPSLFGGVQVSNAATALMGLQLLGDKLPVTHESVDRGLHNIDLLGRFQRISGDCEIILDVAHNLDSAKVLVKNLQGLRPVTNTYAVFAVLADKDVDGIIDTVKGEIDKWFISQLDSERALHCAELQEKLARYCPDCNSRPYASISEAYFAAQQTANASTRIVVFGSFLTVAEVLSLDV